MADIDLKTETPDTSIPTTGFLFGADSQAAASPSVYSLSALISTILGATAFNAATVTTSQPVLNLAQTWNDGAVAFTGLKFNAMDTASAAASLLLDLQVGSSSVFQIGKSGSLKVAQTWAIEPFSSASNADFRIDARTGAARTGIYVSSAGGFDIYANSSTRKFTIPTTGDFRVNSSFGISFTTDMNLQGDTMFRRVAAASLQLGAADAAAPVAQTLGVQGVVAGTANTAGPNFTYRAAASTGSAPGGAHVFQVTPAGGAGSTQNAFATALTIGADNTIRIPSTSSFYLDASELTGLQKYAVGEIGFRVSGTTSFVVGTGYIGLRGAGAPDANFWRDAANVIGIRNGANAQTLRTYGTYTNASNYRRVALSMTTAGVATLLPEGIGTGASGNVIHISGLPTSNPGPGILWNDGGTPAIGT